MVFVTEHQQQEEELGILGVGRWEIEKTQDIAGQWSPLFKASHFQCAGV